jgi:DNA-binding MarR family transcriptional regulator
MEPIGRKLNPEEKAILTVLLQEGRSEGDRSAAGVAMALERDPVDVAGALTRLERDGLTTSSMDADLGTQCWQASSTAAEVL